VPTKVCCDFLESILTYFFFVDELILFFVTLVDILGLQMLLLLFMNILVVCE
jgi:hypothetical protein